MANPHQQHAGFPPYGINPASLANSPAPNAAQNPFYPSTGQSMNNPQMLAAARYSQLKQQQQQQHHQQQQQQQQHQQQQQQATQPNMAFNPAQLQLTPNMHHTPHSLAGMSPQERQIAQAKAMAQHQAQQIHTPSQYAEQQQQQYGYDARMMPPPPPPSQQQQQQHAQRPPSTRPGTAPGVGPMQRPGGQGPMQFPGQQQAFQQAQRFPQMQGFDAQAFAQQQQLQQQQLQQQQHQQQQQQHAQQQQQQAQQQQHQAQQHAQQQQQQAQQQQHHQQQQMLAQQSQQHRSQLAQQPPPQFASSHVPSTPSSMAMNMASLTPSQMQQFQQLQHAQAQSQLHTQTAQGARLSQLEALQQSPANRKRKLPGTGLPTPMTPAAAQNINPNVQRMSAGATDPFAARRMQSPLRTAPASTAPATPQQQQNQQPSSSQPSASHNPALALSLNPAITRVTNVPLAGSAARGVIPPLELADLRAMQEWIAHDKDYERGLAVMRDRGTVEVRDAVKAKIGWWEESVVDKGRGGGRERERFGLLWPEQKRAARVRKLRRAGVRWEGVRWPGKIDKAAAERVEDLVPIRLELDVEHHKLRETFVWNVNDPLVTPEIFAQSIVDDFKLATHHAAAITKAILEQLQEHDGNVREEGEDPSQLVVRTTNEIDDSVCTRGALDAEDEAWWTSWRKRIRTEDGSVRIGAEAGVDIDGDDEADNVKGKRVRRRKLRRRRFGVMVPEVLGEGPMEVDKLTVTQRGADEELRILIKLDILVGTMKLDDQFEWDVGCPANSPEQFATLYATELGLSGEFTTAIAHQIREQAHAHRRTRGLPADDEDLRPALLPPVTRSSVARSVDAASAHMPLLNYMSDGEIERTERERDKELKRKRRTARGRGGARGVLSDRTHRTPGIGFPEADPAALQAAQAANVPTTSRRAAAAAASLTIANMVASENGGSPMQLSAPEPVKPPMAPKEVVKKSSRPQRLFKPPAYPPAALRPRAKVVAPTPSTGLDPAEYCPVIPQEQHDQKSDDAPLPPPPPPVPAKLTAKQLRDLEKEAKEKEYAEGQHENFIDGVWHCSNCGCPETIAVGRRKGPLGDKSQCGPCGKFYHRHRRPRPVEYHSDESYHINLKVEADRAKAVNRRKGGAAALRAMNQEATSAPESSTSVLNLKSEGADQDDGEDDDDRVEAKDGPDSLNVIDIVDPRPDSRAGAASPADTSSSEEPPLALGKNIPSKVNGSAKPRSAPKTPAPAPPSSSVHASPPAPSPVMKPQPSPQLAPAVTSTPPVKPSSIKSTTKSQAPRPEWLKNALDAMQARYPEDKFDVVLRKITDPTAQAEWRVKCLDCPGKLYTPGPAETLANFEVHLKNRFHRGRVNARVLGTSPPP